MLLFPQQETDTTLSVPQATDTSAVHDTSLSVITSDFIADTLDYKIKPDSLIPLTSKPLYDNSTFISYNRMKWSDYRNAADNINLFPASFVRNLGFIGQPAEMFIYGVLPEGIRIQSAGMIHNYRNEYSFDFNLLQSESIDSIEILPLPRGFFQGFGASPLSVNLIRRDFVSAVPYSRIKYYEGPQGEAMVDASFNSMLSRRIMMYFDITNRKYDGQFNNSSFGIWQGQIHLKYLLNNDINFSGYVLYNHYQADRNGGIDVDSIISSGNNINEVLYSGFLAPVVFQIRNDELKDYTFGLRTIASLHSGSLTELNLYNRIEIRTLNNFADNPFQFVRNRNSVLGAYIRHSQDISIFKLDVSGGLETADLKNYRRIFEGAGDSLVYNESKLSDERYFVSASLSIIIPDVPAVPSVFVKRSKSPFTGNSIDETTGAGADITLSITELVKLYGGFSVNAYPGSGFNGINTVEVGLNVNHSGLNLNARVFRIGNYDALYKAFRPDVNYGILNGPGQIYGNGITMSYGLKYLLLEGNGSYYTAGNSGKRLLNFPETSFDAGLYFTDNLFDGNLDLKAGARFIYFGSRYMSDSYGNFINVNSDYRLDLTITGEIQKTAFAYFAWENLLNRNYYITPYYPMPERHIRFGIAWEIFN